MDNLTKLIGRLHSFFITVNLKEDSSFYRRLAGQREVKLIQCESTQLSDISRAFKTVWKLIKAMLYILETAPGDTIPKKS